MAQDISDATIRNRSFPPDDVIFGRSSAMADVRKRVDRVACTDVPILIRGEGGTGKEVLARLIHRRYPGETAPFHKVIPGDRSAWRRSSSFVVPGRASNADRENLHTSFEGQACIGSLFFEEVGELSIASQRKLVRLLHDDQPSDIALDEYAPSLFRVICSTKQEIEQKMKSGSFREDLFYSINIVGLYIPPLRERPEDIPVLVRYLWERSREEFGSETPAPSSQLIEIFQEYGWPGNLRELANMMKRYALLGSEDKIVRELTAKGRRPSAGESASDTSISLKKLAKQEARTLERNIILQTLRETKWNRKQAARALKISYRTLLYKIKEAGLPPKRTEADREKPH